MGLAQCDYVHFQDRLIRPVSCYALLSGCRLPWPPPGCLHEAMPFMVIVTELLVALIPDVWFIPQHQSCLPDMVH